MALPWLLVATTLSAVSASNGGQDHRHSGGYQNCRLPYQLYSRVVGFWTQQTGLEKDRFGGSGSVFDNDNGNFFGSGQTVSSARHFIQPVHQPDIVKDYWDASPKYPNKNIGTDGYSFYQSDNLGTLYYNDYIIVNCGSTEPENPSTVRHFDSPSAGHSAEHGTLSASGLKAFQCKGSSMSRLSCSDPGERLSTEGLSVLIPELQTLAQARASCEQLGRGATLATIRNKEEDALLSKIVLIKQHTTQANSAKADCAFIGFTDEEREGRWKWMNDEPVTYMNWETSTRRAIDQPNNGYGQGSENYLTSCKSRASNEFKWYDVGPPRRGNPGLAGPRKDQAWPYCYLPHLTLGVSIEPSRCNAVHIENGFTFPSGVFKESVNVYCYSGYQTIGRIPPKIHCVRGRATWSDDIKCYNRCEYYAKFNRYPPGCYHGHSSHSDDSFGSFNRNGGAGGGYADEEATEPLVTEPLHNQVTLQFPGKR